MLYSLIHLAFVVMIGTAAATLERSIRKPAGCDFFTKQNAVKILGGDVSWSGEDNDGGSEKSWSCTFVSKSDADGPKVFFVMIKNSSEEEARTAFAAVRTSNKDHRGFEEWQGVGDEAVVHSDEENFTFVMVRKGQRTIRIKVNPSRNVQMENVKSVAIDLAGKI